jgi:outer membrane protein insertion porin family
LGTGKKMSTSVNKTDAQTSLNLSFSNPYYTVDGISRGYSLFYSQTDFSEFNSSNYSTDTYGGRSNFGFPISSRERLSFSVEASQTEMNISFFAPQEIQKFVDIQGDSFMEFTLGSTWSWTTLNRGLFPTAGAKQSLSLEATVPGSELEYYRATYNAQKYFPLSINGDWTFRIRTELGYGDGYGDTKELPFFRNFRAGGVGSIRGFESNSLGPRAARLVDSALDLNGDTDLTNDTQWVADTNSLGGNLLTEASMELVFPLPFIEDQRSMRSVLFVDAGNVFDTECLALPEDSSGSSEHPSCIEGFDAEEIRIGAGVSLTWVTAIGPLTFTFARDLKSQDDDETEGFEFSLGQVF